MSNASTTSEMPVPPHGDNADSPFPNDSPSQPAKQTIYIECYVERCPSLGNLSTQFVERLNAECEQVRGWRFSQAPLQGSHRVHMDIFVIRICAQRTIDQEEETTTEEDEEYHNLRATIQHCATRFFNDKGMKPLLFLFSRSETDAAVVRRYDGVEVVKRLTPTNQHGGIRTSKFGWGEPILESICTVGSVVFPIYAAYHIFVKGSHGEDEGVSVNSTGVNDVIERLSIPTTKRQRLESIAEVKNQLNANCTQLRKDLGIMKARMNNILSVATNNSGNQSSSSSAEASEALQLLVTASNMQLATREILEQLFPLLEETYSGKKQLTHGVACVTSMTVAACALLAFFAPATIPLVGARAANNLVATGVIGIAGAATSCVSGNEVLVNHDQCKRRDEVRTKVDQLRCTTSNLSYWLLLYIFGEDAFKTLDAVEKAVAYDKLAIQIDLVDHELYRQGGLKAMWDEWSNIMGEFVQSCENLAQ